MVGPDPHESRLRQDGGLLTIRRKVVRSVIHRLALSVPEVVELGGLSIWKRICRFIGWSLGPRGIELELADGEAAMTLKVVVAQGARVPQVASALRQRIQRGLKDELGIEVRTVNVHVVSVRSGLLIPADPIEACEDDLALRPPPRTPRFDLDQDGPRRF